VAATFNNWNSSKHPMKKDKKGIWKKSLSLKPGQYEYRYLVDGQWENDPSCPSVVANEFGSQNNLKIVA
jgi:1,4-alpha-glucan branching enzyme